MEFFFGIYSTFCVMVRIIYNKMNTVHRIQEAQLFMIYELRFTILSA